MQSQRLDIVELIEQNPITKLSMDYQGKLIKKIQENFTEIQKKLVVASLYYLNYNSKTDFIIEFDSVWKWLGYSRKDHAKVALEKHFTQEIDYKIGFTEVAGKLKDGINVGGRPKEKILMNINTFKKLCLKSNTVKADEIHDYFIKLEELTQEIINEESIELKLQLENHQLLLLEQKKDNVENDKQLIIELKNKIIDIQNENISLKLKLLKNNNEIINEFGKNNIK